MSASLPNSSRSARSSRAFTLLELMVSVALLAVIIIGLLAMFSQVQRAWKSGITQVDVMEGGRATMALIVRDLQDMAALPQTNAVNFEALYALNSEAIQLDLPDGSLRLNDLQDLSFVRRSGDDWTGVAYRVTNAAWGVGSLYRLEATLLANPLDNYRNYPTNISHLSRYVTGLDRYAIGFGLVNPNYVVPPAPSEPGRQYYTNSGFARVLDGVVHFTVTAYDTNGTVMTNSIFYNAQGFAGFSCTNLSVNGLLTAQTLPSFVEVELAVVEPAVLERFNARIVPGSPPGIIAATNYLARKAGQVHVFRQRVPIRPAATAVGPLLPGS